MCLTLTLSRDHMPLSRRVVAFVRGLCQRTPGRSCEHLLVQSRKPSWVHSSHRLSSHSHLVSFWFSSPFLPSRVSNIMDDPSYHAHHHKFPFRRSPMHTLRILKAVWRKSKPFQKQNLHDSLLDRQSKESRHLLRDSLLQERLRKNLDPPAISSSS